MSGGLLWIYRAIWSLFALGAVITLGWLALSQTMDPWIQLLRLGKGAVLVAVSAILFRRRQRDVVAALLSSAFLLWAITSSFEVTGGGAPLTAGLADRLRFLLLTLALLLFPGGRWSPLWTRHVALFSAAVCLLGIVETLGWLQSRLFLPLAIPCVVAAIGSLFHRLRFASVVERQQSKWIALGLAVGISLILAARAGAALSNWTPTDPLLVEALFQLGVVAIAIGFLVSLLRYRLYDAEAVISRSAAYALLTLCLVATFAGSEALIEMLGQQYFGTGIGNVSAAMATAVAAVLLAPLHSRITDWAEQRFQRDLSLLKQRLPELLTELSGISAPRLIARAALPRIAEAVHADCSALLIDGRVLAISGADRQSAERWSRRRQAPQGPDGLVQDPASQFPLGMPLLCPFGELRGWLLLGPRPDGSRYARDDLDALTAIGPALRSSLFAAREREKEREQDFTAQRLIRRKLEGLLERVAVLESTRGS